MSVTNCTIILDIPHTLLHIPYATWHFLHYQNLLDTIHRQRQYLRNTRQLSLYHPYKLHRLWLTVYLYLVNPHIYMCLRGTLRYAWWIVHAQVTGYWKIMHAGVRILIFMGVFIPELILTCWPLPCTSARNSFLDYICLDEVMVFQWASLLPWE